MNKDKEIWETVSPYSYSYDYIDCKKTLLPKNVLRQKRFCIECKLQQKGECAEDTVGNKGDHSACQKNAADNGNKGVFAV